MYRIDFASKGNNNASRDARKNGFTYKKNNKRNKKHKIVFWYEHDYFDYFILYFFEIEGENR